MPEYLDGIVERRASARAGTGIGGSPLPLIADDGAAGELRQRELALGREELLDRALRPPCSEISATSCDRSATGDRPSRLRRC